MSQKDARILLAIFVIFHISFAVYFATKTPYRQAGYLFSQRAEGGGFAKAQDIGAPDERQHANYIGHLIKNGGLPVFDPKSPELYETYQSHQPPGYYFLARGFAAVVGESDPDSQGFGFKLRLLNCLIGGLAIVGTFFAALRFTGKEETASIAAAFQALLPMNIALSGAISNDPLLICLCCWGLAFLAKVVIGQETSRRDIILCGALMGLSATVKSSGLILILTGIMILGLNARHLAKNSEDNATGQRNIKWLVAAILIALFIPLPVWIRNQSLYGDFLAQKAFREAFGSSAQKVDIIAGIEMSNAAGSPSVQYWMNWVGYWAARSFIGVFGYMDIWMNESGFANSKAPNLIYKAIIAFNFAGLLSFAAFWRSKGKEFRSIGLPLVGLSLLTLALFVSFNNIYFQAQARYLFPALVAISTMLAIGWTNLIKKWQVALALVVLIFGGMTLYSASQLPQEFEARISGTLPSRS